MEVEELQYQVRQGSSCLTFRLSLCYLNWLTKYSKLAANNIITAENHQSTSNCHLILKCLSADIPWNIISNLEQQGSYNLLPSELVVPSASTLSNMCHRECTLTLDAIMKQFPSRNNDSLTVDSWTSTNKLTKMLVLTYHMDWNETLQEVQLGFD